MQLTLQFRFSKARAVIPTLFGGDPVDCNHRSPTAHCHDLPSSSERRIARQLQLRKGIHDTLLPQPG